MARTAQLMRLRLGLPAAAIIFTGLTVWYTYPQAFALDGVPDHQDALFSAWRISWIAHQLTESPSAVFDANIFHAASRTLAYSDAILLLGLIGSPALWLGAPLPVVYNLLVLGSFVLSGLGMFVLVRTLTGSPAAGLVAGTLFGFAPYRLDHYFHLELLWSAWIPLTLWSLHRTIVTGSCRSGILIGTFLGLQLLSCLYYAIFLAPILPVFIAVAGLIHPARRPRAEWLRALAAGLVVAMVVAVPYGLVYYGAARDVGTRPLTDVELHSPMLVSYLASPPDSWLYGWTFDAWGGNERQLFPGFAAMILGLLGLLHRARWRETVPYAVALTLAVDLSLGTNGVTFRVLRQLIPLFEAVRVPARASMLATTFLAILAGYGADRALVWAGHRWPAWRWLAAGSLLVVVCLEFGHQPLGLRSLPSGPGRLETWLAQQPRSVLVHLPLPRPDRLPGEEARYQFASVFHWQPLVNGYSGFYPRSYLRLLEGMEGFPDDRSMGLLRDRQVRFVIVHLELYGRSGRDTERFVGDELAVLLPALDNHPGLIYLGRFPGLLGTAEVYELRVPAGDGNLR